MIDLIWQKYLDKYTKNNCEAINQLSFYCEICNKTIIPSKNTKALKYLLDQSFTLTQAKQIHTHAHYIHTHTNYEHLLLQYKTILLRKGIENKVAGKLAKMRAREEFIELGL